MPRPPCPYCDRSYAVEGRYIMGPGGRVYEVGCFDCAFTTPRYDDPDLAEAEWRRLAEVLRED